MLQTVFGLPAHVLIVHAVVVLLPLGALGSIAAALRPRWRQRYAWPVLGVSLVGALSATAAKIAGENFQERLKQAGVDNELIQKHAALGAQLQNWALGFGAAVIVLFVAGRLADRERSADGPGVTKTWRRISVVVSVLVIALAVVTTVQTVRTGHSGSTAVWTGVGGK
ncbi:hypothetical protein Lesp02_33470 [Lentzea sp. NBRC 105346]|uniref:DUF2231 domain-containing protein n=1 Tax=Lentzea sp. NBRC 105346 TaxID=3032205 RepID=UPI0024A51DA6|nr:DUF2231 domain-containing protein [Lentzea sp. NBRC 105346]GLZ31159.1 hypothetical protein Lesp02_33470 [Lentzea sp. NBRC 105346]